MNFVLSPHLPDTNLTENFSWSSVTETTYTDQGLDINTKTNQEYKVVGFKRDDGNLIAEIKISGNFEFVQKGQTEQDDIMYDVDIHAEGEIRGKIVFDVDNGFLVEYKTDKSRNIKGEEINLSTNEKRPISYFNQETFNAKLLEVVE
jgi:predicted neutral ceramidase superfamily lipid hydrolase